jgi:hypothetical protein
MANPSLKVNPARSPSAAVLKQEKGQNLLDHFLKYINPKYISGTNPIARTQTAHGFTPTKNAALNFGKLMGVPYDPATRVRPGDPLTQLKATTSKIGTTERIYNNYYQPRVKLAD